MKVHCLFATLGLTLISLQYAFVRNCWRRHCLFLAYFERQEFLLATQSVDSRLPKGVDGNDMLLHQFTLNNNYNNSISSINSWFFFSSSLYFMNSTRCLWYHQGQRYGSHDDTSHPCVCFKLYDWLAAPLFRSPARWVDDRRWSSRDQTPDGCKQRICCFLKTLSSLYHLKIGFFCPVFIAHRWSECPLWKNRLFWIWLKRGLRIRRRK